MAVYLEDPGDYYDAEKWDFDERFIPIYTIGKYPYKARTLGNAKKLDRIRKQIDKLCKNLTMNRDVWENSTNNVQYLDGVDVFLGLHKEAYYDPYVLPEPFFEVADRGLPVSRYLLSEIPSGTKFSGLNKPRMRHIDNTQPSVGKDDTGRALYRDIFLDLGMNDQALKKLIIHELAHSMANHIMYRPDDHHADFKWCEELISDYWPE